MCCPDSERRRTGSDRLIAAWGLRRVGWKRRKCHLRRQPHSILIGVFLNLCDSSAVSDAIAMGGHANQIEMVARPRGQNSGCRAHEITVGLFPLPDRRSAFAPTAAGEAEVGIAGPIAAFRICRSQGKPVTGEVSNRFQPCKRFYRVKLLLSRWRCAHQQCERLTFTDRLPKIVSPYARRTTRVVEIVGLLGHSTGGRLGMPVSDTPSCGN